MGLIACPYHHDSLQSTIISTRCDACYEDCHENKLGYRCNKCTFCVHEVCINVYISSRHKHSLKITCFKLGYICCFCGADTDAIYYKCLQCDFLICIPCAKKPLTFNKTKAHEHELLQLPIKMSFNCDACGFCLPKYPCVCLQCCFKIHRECIFLPRVISINCHDHRISHVSSLGLGKWNCGVCYENVDGEYGSYSCSICSYVVHSTCAIKPYIWDGIDLEGVKEIEVSKPFEVIDQDHNIIKHFSHEHNLHVSLLSSRLQEPMEHCYACTLPFYSELCYKCIQCDFILHDACANLPRKKKHIVNPDTFTLVANCWRDSNFVNIVRLFNCDSCRRYCTGFSYRTLDKSADWSAGWSIDVRCASLSGALTKNKSHPHLLFATIDHNKKCDGCKLGIMWYFLSCSDKDNCGSYNLCFRCATLPEMVRHIYDDHPLFLCYGEKNVDVTYCCGICENETCSNTWFYNCNECGSTFHTECVFNNLIHSIPGYSVETVLKGTFNLLLNNRLSRPICSFCKIHCMGEFVVF